MPYIDSEALLAIKQVDLLTYLRQCEPHELVHIGGNVYSTRSHDSLKISNGKWMWWSRGVGGRSALDYLTKVQGLSFMAAAERIAERAANMPPVFASPEPPSPQKTLLLPKASRCATPVFNYLSQRGIDAEIIHFCICTGRLYESLPHHNAVFVGLDREGKPRHAALRGIASDFKSEANGSDKRYSFSIPAEDSRRLHLFESAIDLLSVATLLKQAGKRWQRHHLLSLAGVYQPSQVKEDFKLPLALSQYLEDFPQIRRIELHLDNDSAGRRMTAALIEQLSSRYQVLDVSPPVGKDFNDCLLLMRKAFQKKAVPER